MLANAAQKEKAGAYQQQVVSSISKSWHPGAFDEL